MPDVAAEEAKAFITGLVSMDDDRLLRKLDLARILPDTKTLAK